MALALSTALRPVFRLSADAFPKLAADRFGAQNDMDRTWHTFEPVARTLVDSFYLTLDCPGHDRLVPQLQAVDPELRGIAYEGAGMGMMLLDSLFPYKKRLPAFLHGPGARYRCLIYIGAGLVLPRVPIDPDRFLARQDPFLRWLVMDGYGFYEGFFSWRAVIEGQRVPARVRGPACRAFDQGVGRSLWFSTGANADRIIETIHTFPPARRRDLWSGVGLACAYAAGVLDRTAIATLLAAAGDYAGHFAAGTAVAAVFGEQSGLPAPHTDLTCDVVWGRATLPVARLAHAAALDRRHDGYQCWREQLRQDWERECAPAPIMKEHK